MRSKLHKSIGNLGDRNFWGLNKDAHLGAEVSETGHREEARIYEPRFLGTLISSDLILFFERAEPFNQTFGTDSLGSNIEFSLFYDMGYLDETAQEPAANNTRHSTGMGLRYVTPAGAFGLVYGHKLNPDPDEDN